MRCFQIRLGGSRHNIFARRKFRDRHRKCCVVIAVLATLIRLPSHLVATPSASPATPAPGHPKSAQSRSYLLSAVSQSFQREYSLSESTRHASPSPRYYTLLGQQAQRAWAPSHRQFTASSSSNPSPVESRRQVTFISPFHLPALPFSISEVGSQDRRRVLFKRQVGSGNSDTSAFPEAFDTTLGVEFESTTCGPFIQKVVADPQFKACHPLSLLLTTSRKFFLAMQPDFRNLNQIAASKAQNLRDLLDKSCSVDVPKCQNLMDQLASDIRSREFACGKDISKKNSLAEEALNGFLAFSVMWQIGCLRSSSNSTEVSGPSSPEVTLNSNLDNNTFSPAKPRNVASTSTSASPPYKYCLEKAVRSPTPDDSYYFYLPSGTGLPSGTKPSCDACIQSMMKIYSASASDSKLKLQSVYMSARTMTNSMCGPSFSPLPRSLQEKVSSAPRTTIRPESSQLFNLTSFLMKEQKFSLTTFVTKLSCWGPIMVVASTYYLLSYLL